MTAISSKSLNEGTTNSGNGPVLRRRVVRRRVKRTNSRNPNQPRFTWLSVITCLITMEAAALIILVFRSDSIFHRFSSDATSNNKNNQDPSPLDLLMWLDTTLGGGADEDREELAELEAHLVQRTEDRLDHGGFLEYEVETTALDNYYSRSHLDFSTPSVLILGGLEGSGASAVLDALMHYKISILTLDEASTQNIEAWQNIENAVLEAGIQTANYDFASLPESTQTAVKIEWQKIMQMMPQFSAEGGRTILYAIQAQDALFLLPVLKALISQPIKFLHCIRDGRDLSLLSGKEIPHSSRERRLGTATATSLHSTAEQYLLDHYYQNTDPDVEGTNNQRIVKAMRLWDDFNKDSLQWQQDHADASTFEYLAVRAEDFLSPETKLESLIQLKHFVHAEDMTIESLCCLSRHAMVKQSSEYLKSFAKAQAQKDILKGSDELLLHQQDEEERRKARLGDLMGGKFHRRPRHTPGGESDTAIELDQHRQDRFQNIGERLAERLSSPKGEDIGSGNVEEGDRRRLLETNQLRRRRRLVDQTDNHHDHAAQLLADYGAWRKTFPKAMHDEEAAKVAASTGEKLLAQYRANEQDFEGILTEQSFTRSIKWLKGIHHTDPESQYKTKRYGKWVQILDDQPALAQRLHTIGKESLELFGYEPSARFMDFDPENLKAQCHIGMMCG